MADVAEQIQEIIDRETRAWETQDLDLLISVFHHDMVWPWPPNAQAHDPEDWVFVLGRYDEQRWRGVWRSLFDSHELVHNVRTTEKIEVSSEGDGAFAVVDIDTLWRDHDGNDQRWLGRTCKIYTKVAEGWKMIAQTGVLDYGARAKGA